MGFPQAARLFIVIMATILLVLLAVILVATTEKPRFNQFFCPPHPKGYKCL
jgi:hypothetical protein